MQKLGNMFTAAHNVICYCGNVIYENTYYSEIQEDHIASVDAHIEVVKAKEGVKAEMKAMRTKSTLMKKAYSELNRRINNTKAEFNAAVAPHKLAIETLKEQYMTPMKESEEYKKFRGAKAGLQFLQSKFMKKHELSYRHMPRLMGGNFGRYGAWRWRTSHNMIRRAFRIRL